MLGAKTILLLGFDMYGTHYFGKHPKPLDVESPWQSFRQSLATIKPHDYGIDIINCSRQTMLECFPKINLYDILT